MVISKLNILKTGVNHFFFEKAIAEKKINYSVFGCGLDVITINNQS